MMSVAPGKITAGLMVALAIIAIGQTTSQPTGNAVPSAANNGSPAVKAADLMQAQKPWSHYRVLAQRNIFTRRTSGSSTGESSTRPATNEQTPTPQPPAAVWVLTGVVLQGGSSIAFFENTQTSQTLRVALGQKVDEAQVKRIEADRVWLTQGNSQREVRVGQTITGGQATLREPSGESIFGSSDANAPNATSGAGNPGGSASEQSVIERMRARRAREAGR